MQGVGISESIASEAEALGVRAERSPVLLGGAVIRARNPMRPGSPPPVHPVLSRARGAHHSSALFSSVWPPPNAAWRVLDQPPVDDRWKEGPRQGLPGKVSVEHFRIHPLPEDALDHRRVSRSPPGRQAAGLWLSGPFFPVLPPAGQTRTVLATRWPDGGGNGE